MAKILINGNFLNRNLTGIERFAWEVCSRLDKLLTKDDDVSILVACNAKNFPAYKNIKLIISPKQIKSFPFWDMGTFAKECKKQKACGLNFSNTAPLGKNCGIAFIHDIYAKDCPKDFTSFKDKLVKLYSCFSYSNICRNAKKVITVSNFSKNQIQKAYKVKDNRISVICNGWEHFNPITPDDSILEKFPVLKQKPFYFTMGSLSKRKNLKWIAEYALNHSEELFAISGKAISGLVPPELEALQKLSNVILLGYVTDEQVKCLMSKCKAFVFPSYYEGFGIPPLEALSVGAKVISSNAASLGEIYKKSVHYINPDNSNVDLNALLEEPLEQSADDILKEYTYDKAAQELYNIIKS